MKKFSRREVLASTGALGLASACGGLLAGEPAANPLFPLDVAAGDVGPDSALLWTRYTGGQSLLLKVWEDTALPGVIPLDVAVSPGAEGIVRADVTGLTPGKNYRYAFIEKDGEREVSESPQGRFRAALAPDALEPLRFGAVSCTEQNHSLDTLLRAGERTDLDAFFMLGDTVYADSANTFEQYNGIWQRSLSLTGHRVMRRSTSMIATWDDHEFDNNWGGDTLPKERIEAAAKAFFLHQPVRYDEKKPTRVWRSLKWGKTAEVFVLDGRGERDRARGQYISTEQMAWLKAGLKESPCAFKVILNSVPIGRFGGAIYTLFASDRWEGFPDQRDEILSHVDREDIRGVLWVSGDFHLACMGRVSMSGPGSKAIEVLVGPGAQDANPLPSYPSHPQFDWASAINNYTTFDLDPRSMEALIRYHSGKGKVFAERTYSLG
ncbi:MAG: alkaline phosphatase D family protein [Myxococcaceae bacterium]|nr:alkaline phosphatase D family protein [Myxococcaceae bacterium]